MEKTLSKKQTALLALSIIVLAGLLVGVIFYTEPQAVRAGATRKTAMLVDVETAVQADYYPTINAMGTVVPSREVELSPQVSGSVVLLSSHFTPGSNVGKGQLLLRIDPGDYKNRLEVERAGLQQALAELRIEEGKQNVARQDFEMFRGEDLPAEQKSLILREPQLESARSRVRSAKAAVAQAELELRRTELRAPFDAHIVSRSVNRGSRVSPGQKVGHLVGRHTYWIETTIPQAKARWIAVPGDGDRGGRATPGSYVYIRNRSAWDPGDFREGRVFKMIGALSGDTRMVRLLVAVNDPLARTRKNRNRPALLIGSFVEVRIEGKQLKNVIRLNRDYIHTGNTVRVMKNKRLQICKVDIQFQDAKYAYIRSGLSDGASVVTTNLSAPAEGALLRVKKEEGSEKQ